MTNNNFTTRALSSHHFFGVGIALGVLAVYSQLVKHQTTRSEVMDSYIQEMLRRAGLPACDFARGVYSNDPIVSSLLKVARAININLKSEYPETNLHLAPGTSPEQFAHIETPISWSPRWDLLWPTRLFMTRGETGNKEKALWFCNRDVLCYLAAIDNEFYVRSLGKENETRQSINQLRQQMRAYLNEHWEGFANENCLTWSKNSIKPSPMPRFDSLSGSIYKR